MLHLVEREICIRIDIRRPVSESIGVVINHRTEYVGVCLLKTGTRAIIYTTRGRGNRKQLRNGRGNMRGRQIVAGIIMVCNQSRGEIWGISGNRVLRSRFNRSLEDDESRHSFKPGQTVGILCMCRCKTVQFQVG